MNWLSASAVPAAIMAGVFLVTIASGRGSRRLPIATSSAATLFGCLLGTLGGLQGLLLLLASLAYARAKYSFRTFVLTCAGATMLPLALSFGMVHREVTMIDELREEFPVTSLSHRLVYEREHTPAVAKQELDSPELNAEIKWGLTTRDAYRRESLWERNYLLGRIHDETYKQFVIAAGFGPVRMLRIRPDRVRLPPRKPVNLVCRTGDMEDDVSNRALEPEWARTFDERLMRLHWEGVGDFLQPDRMGYVANLEHVVGFEPHAFSKLPAPPRSDETWQIVALELVSLLKHAAPRVYESEYLPNMELLSSDDIPTRELDEFEAEALPQLRTERDVVIDAESHPGTIRMLGSLRADTDCTQCHNVRRGDLLGAFSYFLWRSPTATDTIEQKGTESTKHAFGAGQLQ